VFFSVHWRSCEYVLCCWYICWYVLRELFVYLPTTTFKVARWPRHRSMVVESKA
jgi:hypothetical protein